MNSLDMTDIPPPLPLKGSMADYGNLMESQESISPATSPPVPQRVSFAATGVLLNASGTWDEMGCNVLNHSFIISVSSSNYSSNYQITEMSFQLHNESYR